VKGNANRLVLVGLILLGSAILIQRRGGTEKVPSAEPLSNLPSQIDRWRGRNREMDARVLEVLGPGKFLSRLYTSSSAEAPVDLFIGYFPSQQAGNSIHSPKHCLPGAGWYFESSSTGTLSDREGKRYPVGEYVIANGISRQYVIYWYYAHGRSIPNEYSAKYYLIRDAIRMNRTDGALVRVITPIDSNESLEVARSRAVSFATDLAPDLHRYIPD
jgi:EpsI family protein